MRAMVAAAVALAAIVFGVVSPAEAQNRFWLVNATGMQINEAYVSPSRLSEWGPDILGAGVLPAGQQVWVTPNFGDCVLDVRVRYANGAEDTRMGVNACSLSRIVFGGGAGAAIGGGPGAAVSPGRAAVANPSFTFVNNSGETIRELYVSLTSQRDWGPDRLGQDVLEPGGSVALRLPQAGVCTVDIRVVYMNGAAAERRGVETCSINAYGWN
jgi:hypothetical protein